ncbi:MAG TPA: DUF4259 domain-containing protein [Sphingomicrobium sp.]|nr:DUF4259 domain-containing protein [Sphingomicrobium sp.]
MGAWGSGSFENDTAMDWAASVRSVDDVRKPFDRLKLTTDAAEEGPNLVLDSDFACELVAAAETVAMMMGRKSRDFPDDLAQRLADGGEPDDLLFHQARNAALHAMRNSELAELWEETTEEGGANEWLAELTRLIDRLNPEIESVPWEPEEVEQKVGASAGPCAFCGQPVSRDEMFLMTLFDATNKVSFDRGFWFHLPCLNARVHHKHAIADLKFDPDNMPDLDKL